MKSGPSSVSLQSTHSFMQYTQQSSGQFAATRGDSATSPGQLLASLGKILLATALFRCWNILVFFAVWSTAIAVISDRVHNLGIQPTLLTAMGTVLGFVISYRTTSSFERYNEGRRYWSQIFLASRTLARGIWLQVPDTYPPTKGDEGRSEEDRAARVLIEKKTVINLIEAFAVSMKHYLRGEEGINYEDLYHLVKFLPSYAPPVNAPSDAPPSLLSLDGQNAGTIHDQRHTPDKDGQRHTTPANLPLPPSPTNRTAGVGNGTSDNIPTPPRRGATAGPHVKIELPLPATAGHAHKLSLSRARRIAGSRPFMRAAASTHKGRSAASGGAGVYAAVPTRPGLASKASYVRAPDDEVPELLPASMPTGNSIFDFFPFSLFIKRLTRDGLAVGGERAARYRAHSLIVRRNVPLEILMYLTSYIAMLNFRKIIDTPTANVLINSSNQLMDAMTGLDRILTTPIPFSYSIHLWLVTTCYCLALPLQIWNTMRWVTIPATIIVSFMFFGFLVAGEEIEDPFGYDLNDLNMEHFTHDIIRTELRALTACAPPDPSVWAFDARNDRLFADSGTGTDLSLTDMAYSVHPMRSTDLSNLNEAPENNKKGSQDNDADATPGPGEQIEPPEVWVRRGVDEIREALAWN